ncbi:protein kinase domain-containing protein [Polyangium mundeleinium]|uniref:protein kinase domain-containing protein n=1 Tax=Polyangium mundeleinium TaxID=2995306 RepID=UPI00358DC887
MRRDNSSLYTQDPDEINRLLPPHVRAESLLGDGGQGLVFKGHVNGLPAAIKLYVTDQIETRIEREVNALVRLNCRSIARLLWSGDIVLVGEKVRIVATSFVPGRPLSEVLKQRKLSDDDVCAMAYDVAAAIHHMWELRVVHRDLKPSNLIVEPSGRVSVIDLGIARHVSQSSITGTGMTWGTTGYLSPEQMRGTKQLTCKSDVFALGIVMLEARLGRHPTQRDQVGLMSSRYHEFLPGSIGKSSYADLLKSLLQPRPTARPVPAAIMQSLASHARDGGK